MATSAVYTYSPQEVQLVVGGYTVTGWESISIARSNDGFQPIRGIRGKNTRVFNQDTSAMITIPLIQTSPANDVFSQIHELDLINGTGRLEIMLKDRSGGSVYNSAEAYIIGYPEVTYSGTFSYRNWRIFCQSTSFIPNGNSSAINSIFNSLTNEASSFIQGLL